MSRVATGKLSAQPNAGRPREIEGRHIYLSSPEYMASYARRFIAYGVRLVGGCCGTTPDHIRHIKQAVRAVQIKPDATKPDATKPDATAQIRQAQSETVPRGERSE